MKQMCRKKEHRNTVNMVSALEINSFCGSEQILLFQQALQKSNFI